MDTTQHPDTDQRPQGDEPPDETLSRLDEADPAAAPDIAEELAATLTAELDAASPPEVTPPSGAAS